MNSQIYLSMVKDEPSANSIIEQLRRNGLDLVRNFHVVPESKASKDVIARYLSHFSACLVLVGETGLTKRQTIDVEAAVEQSNPIIVLLLPGVSRPSEMTADLRDALWIELSSLSDQPSYGRLVEAIKNPAAGATRGGGTSTARGGTSTTRGGTFESVQGGANTAEESEVYLGVAAPRRVQPDSEFVARFSAYTEEFRQTVADAIRAQAPQSEVMLDLDSCRWKIGAKVTVSLSARGLTVDNSPQQFEWNGKWKILNFDVEVPADRGPGSLSLKFNVTIEGITISSLRPEIEVVNTSASEELATVEASTPKTAFASYATVDRETVLSRVRAMQIWAGVDVFVDCLELRPGERWKSQLEQQIAERDVFLLFWSRRARASQWVEWEWQMALEKKGLDAVQPHPLEPADVAPPPKELEELQFGNAFERYIMDLSDRSSSQG